VMRRWFAGSTATFPCINGNKLYLQEGNQGRWRRPPMSQNRSKERMLATRLGSPNIASLLGLARVTPEGILGSSQLRPRRPPGAVLDLGSQTRQIWYCENVNIATIGNDLVMSFLSLLWSDPNRILSPKIARTTKP